MKKTKKTYINFIVIVLSIVVTIITVIRIFSNTTENASFSIHGVVDDSIKMVDARCLELEFDAPIAGMTGFSFRFEGDREYFGNAGFLVMAAIENNPEDPQMLYSGEISLEDQTGDGQSYIVMIPFEGDIQQGDHLRILIMGIGISEEDNIAVKTSSQSGLAGAVFEKNDYVQDVILVANFYYQTKKLVIFPVLIQGIIAVLCILLLGEICKRPKPQKVSTMRKAIPNKNRMIKLIPIIIFLIVVFDYTYYAGVKPCIQNIESADKVLIHPGEDASFRELCNGETVFCQSWTTENYFDGLGIYLKEPYNDNGIFTVEVIDGESQEVVASAQKAIYELIKDEGNFLKLQFDSPVKKSVGTEYLISIYYSGVESVEILGDGSEENSPKLIPLYQKNNYLNFLFILFCILVTGFTFIIFWCIQNRVKLEKLLVISIVFLGILFATVITPFAVPDEASHIDTAYRLSNQMLGMENTQMKDAIYKRECDANAYNSATTMLDEENYRWLYDDWFNTGGTQNTRLVFASDNTATTNALFFLPTAVGITVGRILGIGFLPMIALARLANLLLAAWMIYLAVKKIPFGKSILCVIALLPITLQEIASCSYDSPIIAVSMLYVSYCIFAIYSREKLEKVDILVIFITAILLGACKGGAYTPLYLLGMWIPIKRRNIRLPQKKELRIAGIAVVLGVILAAIIGVVYVFIHTIDSHSLRGSYYSLMYLLQHPLETIRIFENTLYQNTYYYVVQGIGIGLGCLQIMVRFITPLGYLLLIMAAVICDEKNPHIVDKVNKRVFLITSVLTSLTVFVAFLLTYVSFGEKSIGGVQGRYFIPVLWLILVSLRCGRIVNKKKQYEKIVLTGYFLGIGTVLQIVINVLNVLQ